MIKSEIKWMSLAIQLAKKGLYYTEPNPRVGCVIVKNNQLIGQGWHQRAGQNHAEINALNSIKDNNAKDATVYVSLEPCCHQGKTPPCVSALIKAQVAKVVVAMIDPNPLVSGNGIQALKKAGIKVELGLLEQQAKLLNPGFISIFNRNRPWVRLKLAMSLDGRTAMKSGESMWVTGNYSRKDGHKLRAQSGAIITGIGTVLKDNPQMTVRGLNIGRQPIRVVLDSKLKVPLDANIFQSTGQVIIFCCQSNSYKKSLLEQMNVKVIEDKSHSSKLDLKFVLSWLAKNSVNEVLIEAGATLAASFIEQKLVDELIVYMSTKIMGATARPLVNLPLNNINDAIEFKLKDIRQIDKDIKFTLIP